ncbi:hypothetical protein ACFVTF_23385 [Kitasatospora sp. NPDC057940]|uniref:hypothetical protein n=1 Tax=Kitasatospora sp. NPDC057940 TaxID=3346285 RepID=UPI0036DB6906
MPYPNDLILGITAAGFNQCIGAVYKSHPKWFKGTTTQSGVSVSWDVTKAPTVVVGPPDKAKWDKATDAAGRTPPASPDTTVLQVTLPSITVQVGSDSKNSASGVDVVVYMDVKRNYVAFKPFALAADLGGKLSALDREALLELLPVILETANNSLPEFELPKIGSSDLIAASRGVVDNTYLALGANRTKGTSTEHGFLDNLNISEKGQVIWKKNHPCVIAIGPGLTEPMLAKAIMGKAGELGLNTKQTFSESNAGAEFFVALKGVAMLRTLVDPVFSAYVALQDFKVTVLCAVEWPKFSATTSPDPIEIQCEFADLTDTEVKVKLVVPKFETRYKHVSGTDLFSAVENKLNNEHNWDPWKNVKERYDGKTYTFPFSLPLEMKSKEISVRLKPLEISGQTSYLVLGADLKAA